MVAAAKILASTSPAFQELHKQIGARMRAVFPEAETTVSYGMAGWQVPVTEPPPADEWKGTMDRMHLQVFPTEKKAGITTHIWHPLHPDLLKEHEERLQEAGFKVMVGCLQWNRKAPFPLDTFEEILREAEKTR